MKIQYSAVGDIGIDHFVSSGKKLPGGMALNSAFHAQKAGAHASIVSAVGDDKDGDLLREFMSTHSLSMEGLEICSGKTNSVEITLDSQARPQYGLWDLGVLKGYHLTAHQKTYLSSQDIVITVHLPELRGMFDDVAGCTLHRTLKVGDFTDLSEYGGDMRILEEYKKSFGVYVVSIDEEIESRKERLRSFVERENAMGIALLGPLGSSVFFHGREYYRKADPVAVIDTTGAGDTYLAYFLTSYLTEKDIPHAMDSATTQAALTIGHVGALGEY